jgi:hypothetical protein
MRLGAETAIEAKKKSRLISRDFFFAEQPVMQSAAKHLAWGSNSID